MCPPKLLCEGGANTSCSRTESILSKTSTLSITVCPTSFSIYTARVLTHDLLTALFCACCEGIFTEGKNTQLVYQSVDSSAFVVHGGDFAHAAVHSIGDLDSDFGPPPPDLNLANQRALDLGDQFGQGLEPHLAQGEFLSDLGWPSFGGYAQDASTPTLNHGYSSNAAESQVHSFDQPGLPGPSPQHHFTFPISSASDARTIDRTNTIPHSSTDLGNSGTPPGEFIYIAPHHSITY